MQLIIKHATGRARGEVCRGGAAHQQKHKSVAGLMRDSSAARSALREEQEKLAEVVLRHLSWSPQRMSSRHKPYGRASLRPRALFAFLAARAEHGGDADVKAAALHNKNSLAPFRRMALAGMMADVTWEHRKAVMWSDDRDPDPSDIVDQLDGFLHRIRYVIGEGLIFSDQLNDTFTAQIIKFYRKHTILKFKTYAAGSALPTTRAEYCKP